MENVRDDEGTFGVRTFGVGGRIVFVARSEAILTPTPMVLEAGLMEQWGSGYQRIVNACIRQNYPEPEWQELGACVRVIFRPHPDVPVNEPVSEPVNEPVNELVNERQHWFMAQLQRGGQVKAEDIVSQWKVSLATAKRDIASLREKELVEFVGATKTGSYRSKTSGNIR